MDKIVVDWRTEHAELYGRHTLRLKHRLDETGLFSDETLGALIEKCPPSHYNLHAMGAPEDPRMDWKRGLVGERPGVEIIQGIREGRLWLNLRRVHEVDARFAAVLDRMFGEFEANVPGLSTFRRTMGVLISSPRAQVYYHADVPGQSLWQVRGRKRIWIYPNVEPFLKKTEIEDMILGLSEEELTYAPWFDDYADAYDLEPGEMLTWGLNGPHRVVNEDVLNVSVTTEHYTPEIRRTYAVRYGNALLRRNVGLRNTTDVIQGPGFYAKLAIAAAHRTLLRRTTAAKSAKIDFVLDKGGQRPFAEAAA